MKVSAASSSFATALAAPVDPPDPFAAEAAGLAGAVAERRWHDAGVADRGDGASDGDRALAHARLAVNLFAQGHPRTADAQLRRAESVLYAWADHDAAARDNPSVQVEVAVVACVRALVEAELSVRVEPVLAAARSALARCGRALGDGGPAATRLGALAPWAWSVVDAWLSLLNPPTPAACAEVFDAVGPLLDAGAPLGEPWTVDGLIDFAVRLRRIGPPVAGLPGHVVDGLVLSLAAPTLDLGAVVDGARRPDAGLWAGDAGLPRRAAARPSWSERLAGLVTLPDTDTERRRLAAALVHLAARVPASTDPAATPSDRAAAVARLRVAAARLWADAGRWESVIEALALAAGTPVEPGGADHRAWCDVVHRVATAPDAGDARRRSRRRAVALRRWLVQGLPAPQDPVEEARWRGDLAAWDDRGADALGWRREALRRVDRTAGPASLDHLVALQALRDTMADHDSDHPDLESVHDEGAELSLRLCGPLSAEHWWWRGMRALWWHAQGHPQALVDAAAEAEVLIVQTVRSGDALACACMRELVASARRVRPPAGAGTARWPVRPGVQ